MKILIVNYEYPPLGGGGGVLTRMLVRGLARDHDVTVLTSEGPQAGVPDDGARIIRVPVVGRTEAQHASPASLASWVPSGVMAGARLTKHWVPDVVHTFFAIPSGPVGAWTARRTDRAHVLTVIGGDIHDPSRRFSVDRFKPLRSLASRIVNGADAVTAISRDVADRTTTLTGRPDIEVIPCAAEERPIPSPNRSAFGWEDTDVVVTTVARLIPRKSIDTLIRAMGRIDGNVRLEVIGDGPERQELEALARSVRPDRVRFRGHVDDTERDLLIASADIFALPSLHEGFGIAAVEAMRAGLPVVATDSGGPPEFITADCGYLVPPRDVAALADRLHHLASDRSLRDRMGEAAVRRAADFTPAPMVARYVDGYDRALRHRTERGREAETRRQITYYADAASTFERSVWSLGQRDNRNHHHKLESLRRALQPAPGELVLEVGTGTGLHARTFLAETEVRYVGLDASLPMLTRARDRLGQYAGRSTLLTADGHRLPFADAVFDHAFCSGTLHHLSDPSLALRELVRVVRRGGRVAALEPNWKFPSVLLSSLLVPVERNTFKIDPVSLERWGHQAGLEDVRVEHLLYTPPRPERMTQIFDRVDEWMASKPVVRRLSIMLLLSGRRS